MSNLEDPVFGEFNEKIVSDDPSIKREAIELLMGVELTPDFIERVSDCLKDSDAGVRDAASVVLSFNPTREIPEFIVPLIGDENIAVRNLAGDILIRRGIESVDAITTKIPHVNDDDKKFLIDVLALIGDHSPKDVVMQTLKETQNENVVLACIEALGAMKVHEALPMLQDLYRDNELYRPTIVETFGKIEDPSVLPFVMESFPHADTLTQFAMLESIGDLGDESSFFFLLTHLKNSQPPLTWAVVDSIRKLKERLYLDIPYDESTKNALLITLNTADRRYQKSAAAMLSYFMDTEVVDSCIANYGQDYEIDAYIQQLLFSGPSLFFKRIIEFIKPQQQNLRQLLELLKIMVESDGGESLRSTDTLLIHNLCDGLTACITDPSEEIRRSAMELLFFINPDTAFVFIDTMVSDANTWNRLRLLDLLEVSDRPEAFEAIKVLAKDNEEMVQQRAEWIVEQRENSEQS